MKKNVCLLIVLFCVVSFAFAANVSYRWRYVGEEEIECFEYKFLNDSWTKVGKEQTKITLSCSDSQAKNLADDAFLIRSAIGERKSVAVKGYPVVRNTEGKVNNINAAILPWSLQFITESKNDESLVSDYGLGAEVYYQGYFLNSFYGLGGMQWSIFFNPDDKPVFNSLIEFAGFGYKLTLNEPFAAFADISIGCDTHFYDGITANVLATLVNLGLETQMYENVSAKLSCRGIFEFSSKDDTDYANYRILPSVGLCVKF